MFGWFSKKKSDVPTVAPKTPLKLAQDKIDYALYKRFDERAIAHLSKLGKRDWRAIWQQKIEATQDFRQAVGLLNQLEQPDTREFALYVHSIRTHIATLSPGEGTTVLTRAANALPASEDASAKMQLEISAGKALSEAGQHAEGAILLRTLQRQVSHAFGDFSRDNGDLQEALALAMWGCDQLEDALSAAQQALEIFQKIEGGDGLRVAKMLCVLMPGIQNSLGQADMRDASLRRAVKTCLLSSKKLDDETRQHYAAALIELASVLAPRGEAEEADKCMTLALHENTLIYGDIQHPAVIRVLEKLEMIARSGNLPAAQKYAVVLDEIRRGR